MTIRTLIAVTALGLGMTTTPLAFANNDGAKPSMGQSVSQYASDTALTAKIKAAFVGEKSLSALDISVETSNGVSTLSGKVSSQAEAELAEKLTREVDGVKDVHNKLEVEPIRGN